MLVVINLPLIQIWVTLLKVPYRVLYLFILGFCVGVYSLNNSTVDIFMLIAFGIAGYAFSKWKLEPAPLLLAFVLGPLIEENPAGAAHLERRSVGVRHAAAESRLAARRGVHGRHRHASEGPSAAGRGAAGIDA